jgi:hypothetical protein
MFNKGCICWWKEFWTLSKSTVQQLNKLKIRNSCQQVCTEAWAGTGNFCNLSWLLIFLESPPSVMWMPHDWILASLSTLHFKPHCYINSLNVSCLNTLHNCLTYIHFIVIISSIFSPPFCSTSWGCNKQFLWRLSFLIHSLNVYAV